MSTNDELLLDMLTARATEGLSADEQRELDGLLATSPDADPLDMELAAAAATNAFARADGRGADIPAGLKDRLLADARRHFEQRPAAPSATVTDISERSAARRHTAADKRDAGNNGPALGTFNRLGWAAAAMLLIALIVVNRPLPDDEGGAPAAPIEARAELIREAPGTIVLPWNPPEAADYADVSGDVVWNNARQEGYLRLAGMPANDPARAQYQLWIVDPERDEQPVDGGVFDIPGGRSEVIVPIKAKLGILDPQAFAITLEQPGGVVVSDGPLLVVASAG
jgi:anti-sigma-K factor RskA